MNFLSRLLESIREAFRPASTEEPDWAVFNRDVPDWPANEPDFGALDRADWAAFNLR